MSSDDVVISVRNLTKTYRMFSHPGDRLKQAVTFGLRKYHKEFTALDDVSFDIRKGESIGIVGRNGSGKSTLLQLICGILKPTSGSVKVAGRLSALLELGAGFNPEFTGRENVYFQAALLGMSKEKVDQRFADIAAFADIGAFIDQPVRVYSSGMFVRLAFSTMIHADADILVIDEALAVGDEAFQKKCFERLSGFLDDGEKVLIFVSHNARQIERICDYAIWLEKGQMSLRGVSAEVCDAYHNKLYEALASSNGDRSPIANIADSGEVEVVRVELTSGEALHETTDVVFHKDVQISVDFHCHVSLVTPEIVIGFHTIDGVFISAASSAALQSPPSFREGRHSVVCRVPDMALLPGSYYVRFGIFDRFRRPIWVGHRLSPFNVVAPVGANLMRIPSGLVDMPFEWDFTEETSSPDLSRSIADKE